MSPFVRSIFFVCRLTCINGAFRYFWPIRGTSASRNHNHQMLLRWQRTPQRAWRCSCHERYQATRELQRK